MTSESGSVPVASSFIVDTATARRLVRGAAPGAAGVRGRLPGDVERCR